VGRASTEPGFLPFDLEGAREQADPTGLLGAETLQRLHRSPLERAAQQLASHVRAGGIILLVRVFQNDEEQAVCQILLRHGGVQTHEFRMIASGPYPASGQPRMLGTHVWLTVIDRRLPERGSASPSRIIRALGAMRSAMCAERRRSDVVHRTRTLVLKSTSHRST
jgi:hypothetical protein